MPMLPFRQQALPLGASHAHAALLFAENFWHQHFDVSSENAFCAWVLRRPGALWQAPARRWGDGGSGRSLCARIGCAGLLPFCYPIRRHAIEQNGMAATLRGRLGPKTLTKWHATERVGIAKTEFRVRCVQRGTTAAATTRASMKRSIVTRSRAIDRRNASRCQ